MITYCLFSLFRHLSIVVAVSITLTATFAISVSVSPLTASVADSWMRLFLFVLDSSFDISINCCAILDCIEEFIFEDFFILVGRNLQSEEAGSPNWQLVLVSIVIPGI
jgi:hypothetical protein